MTTSGAAAFTGVLSVVLTTKGKITAFFWGAINSLLYGLFAYAYGYAGDAQLNLFYFLPLQFWGAWVWGDNILNPTAAASAKDTVESQSLKLWQWLLTLIITGGICVGFYYEIPVFARAISGVYFFEGKQTPRILDSASNALSAAAQILLILRYNEQWYFWLAVNIIQIIMFTGIAGYGIVINIVVMWCLFAINSLCGLYAWNIRQYLQSTPKDANQEQDYVKLDRMESNRLGGGDSKEKGYSGSKLLLGSDKEVDFGTHLTNPFALGNDQATWQSSYSNYQRSSGGKTTVVVGLVVGKFWPYHKGHEYLLTQALQQCDELLVIICHRPAHSPSGENRAKAMLASFKDSRYNYKVVRVKVINDGYDPLDSHLWASLSLAWIKHNCTGIDIDACRLIAFSSELYGDRFAAELTQLRSSSSQKVSKDLQQVIHVLVDLKRSLVPISGTMIRSNPFQHWRYLPDGSKRVMARRIILIGAESTGKTTLSQLLATRYKTNWVLEYGRLLCEKKLLALGYKQEEGKKPPEFEFTDDDFEEIIREQSRMEDEAAIASSNGLIFADTNTYATLFWYQRYMNRVIPQRLLALQRSLFVEPLLYFFCDTDGSIFVQDGLRDGEKVRQDMNDLFLSSLREQGLPYTRLRGNWAARQNKAVAKCDRLLPADTIQSSGENNESFTGGITSLMCGFGGNNSNSGGLINNSMLGCL